MLFNLTINTVTKTPEGYITALIDTIEDRDIQNFVLYCFENESIKDTFKKAASSGGKYHPEVSNKEWGLLNHTCLAMAVLDTFIMFYKPQMKVSEIEWDVARAAIILHDAWKYTSFNNMEYRVNKFTTKEHGFVAAKKILSLINEFNINATEKEKLYQIVTAVRYHMSNWCHDSKEIYDAQNNTNLIERIVMLCDFVASNKTLLNYVGI